MPKSFHLFSFLYISQSKFCMHFMFLPYVQHVPSISFFFHLITLTVLSKE
jgi:hypothetical protein